MSNVLNVDHINGVIESFLEKKGASIETSRWFKTTFRKYVLREWPFRMIVTNISALPEWAVLAISNNVLVEEVFISEHDLEKYYTKYIESPSKRISVHDLITPSTGEVTLHEVSNRIRWIRPNSLKKYSKYGFHLRSCLKNYFSKFQDGLIDIHLLLDGNKAVVVVGIVDNIVTQIKGFMNDPVERRLWSTVRDYISKWDDIELTELPNVGMITKDQFIEDGKDIKTDFKDELRLKNLPEIKTNSIECRGDLDVSDTVEVFISGGTIGGNFYCRNCHLEIEHLIVRGNTFGRGLKNKEFDEHMIQCDGSIYLQNSNISKFSYGVVTGELNIDNTPMETVGSNFIGQTFYARHSNIKELPCKMGGGIIVPNTQIDKLNIDKVYGDLDISGTPIKKLRNIIIIGNLYILNSQIKEIDKSVNVGGVIFVNQKISFEKPKDRLIFQARNYGS